MSRASLTSWSSEYKDRNELDRETLHETDGETSRNQAVGWFGRFRLWVLAWIDRSLNANLPPGATVRLRIGWPLVLLPIALINQILAPHPVWIVLLVVVAGVYGIAIFWLRHQVQAIELLRARIGESVVAGEPLVEQFTLFNRGYLPALWTTVEDYSDLPGYNLSRVVACGADSSYKWQTDALCGQRGLFQLGPSMLRWSDPLGLLVAQKYFPDSEKIVIYPQIAQLPEFRLPFGSVGGARQLQHPLIGSIRSASVRPFQPGDTLRHVHWPTTARQRNMMVTELDAEHGGEVWLVLDLNGQVHRGEDEHDTLEYSIRVVASLAAQLLHTNERLSVGLLMGAPNATTPGGTELAEAWATDSPFNNAASASSGAAANSAYAWMSGLQVLAPQPGEAQFWEIMGALAMARAVPLPLFQLLQSSRPMISNRQSLIVITADLVADTATSAPGEQAETAAEVAGEKTGDGLPPEARSSAGINVMPADSSASAEGGDAASGLRIDSQAAVHEQPPAAGVDAALTLSSGADWMDALAQTKMRGRNSVVLIQHDEPTIADDGALPGSDGAPGSGEIQSDVEATPAAESSLLDEAAAQRQALLTQQEIGCTVMRTSQRLVPLHTRKRVRREVRSTPMGGAVTIEVEESM